jgi:hypothetical protein
MKRRGEEELEKARKKGTHFEEEEAHKERAHLLGDEGALVLEVESTLEGRRFAEEEGCIASWKKGKRSPEKEGALQGTAGTCFMADWTTN